MANRNKITVVNPQIACSVEHTHSIGARVCVRDCARVYMFYLFVLKKKLICIVHCVPKQLWWYLYCTACSRTIYLFCFDYLVHSVTALYYFRWLDRFVYLYNYIVLFQITPHWCVLSITINVVLFLDDSTGLYSVYTEHEGKEIMFHVSTLLPFTPNNRLSTVQLDFT